MLSAIGFFFSVLGMLFAWLLIAPILAGVVFAMVIESMLEERREQRRKDVS